MRKSIIRSISISFFVFTLSITCGTSRAEDWKEVSGDHFIVYYLGDERFAREVEDKAEFYYQRIATDLGYPRYSDFWTWDKRVKIYIYQDHASFLKATRQPGWAKGIADYTKKEIISYVWSQGFVESLLPHEMAHLIFRDFVGFKGEIPLWLDEGVAQWAEEDKRKMLKAMVKDFYEKDSLLTLQDMMKIDIRKLEQGKVYLRSMRTKDGESGILFLDSKSLVDTYYLQGASLVSFLIERYGSESFSHFCRQLRDGKSLDEALSFAYPTYIHNVNELEKEWRKYLGGQ